MKKALLLLLLLSLLSGGVPFAHAEAPEMNSGFEAMTAICDLVMTQTPLQGPASLLEEGLSEAGWITLALSTEEGNSKMLIVDDQQFAFYDLSESAEKAAAINVFFSLCQTWESMERLVYGVEMRGGAVSPRKLRIMMTEGEDNVILVQDQEMADQIAAFYEDFMDPYLQ